jgi:hypothetical protein
MTRLLTCGLVLLALSVAACSAGDPSNGADSSPEPEPSVTVARTPDTSIAPSDAPEASEAVEPSLEPVGEAALSIGWAIPFTITAPADWGRGEAAIRSAVDVVDGTGLRTVLSAFLKADDTPDDWVRRLTEADALDASTPESVDVDGATGVVFDVRLTDAAPECAAGGSSLGGRCIVVHGPQDGWVWVIEGTRPARVWVLDVDGETVVLLSDAREDRFEAWARVVDGVVATLEWERP